MRRASTIIIGLGITLCGLVLTPRLHAASLSEVLAGQILLQVEEQGKAWYVHPQTQTRHLLGSPENAFKIMREQGLGISNQNLVRLLGHLPVPATTPANTPLVVNNAKLAKHLAGRIILQVEAHGEAYYLDHDGAYAWYLGRPADAFQVMRERGLGISNIDLEKIAAAKAVYPPSAPLTPPQWPRSPPPLVRPFPAPLATPVPTPTPTPPLPPLLQSAPAPQTFATPLVLTPTLPTLPQTVETLPSPKLATPVPVAIPASAKVTYEASELDFELEVKLPQSALVAPTLPPAYAPAGTLLKTVSILDVPLPETIHCTWTKYRSDDAPECAQYYSSSQASHVCRKQFIPVYDSQGLLYPSPCFAERLGVADYQYGYSERMVQFVRDLWATPKADGNGGYVSYIVPQPNIEFSYALFDTSTRFKDGISVFSTLWTGNGYTALEYNIDTNRGTQRSATFFADGPKPASPTPPFTGAKKTLLTYVMFDETYPGDVLVDWMRLLAPYFNDHLRKRQRVNHPIQYEIVPVAIPPPPGVARKAVCGIERDQEADKIFEAAAAKLGQRDFGAFIVVYVSRDPAINGSYAARWRELPFAKVTIRPIDPYAAGDKEKAVKSFLNFAGFHGLIEPVSDTFWGTLAHEAAHTLGAGHQPFSIDFFDEELIGHSGDTSEQHCRRLRTNPNVYHIPLPDNLTIKVGAEPSWTKKVSSPLGSCLLVDYKWFLVDQDNDGNYDLPFVLESIPQTVQRTLGWQDIDGDGITEIEDPSPYGGYAQRTVTTHAPSSLVGPLSFEVLGERDIAGCRFTRAKFSDGAEGLIPLACGEFNEELVNIYRGMRYGWLKVKKDYGDVYLARLPGKDTERPDLHSSFCPQGGRYFFLKGAQQNLEKVCGLFLTNNFLTELPTEVTAMRNLRELDLVGNYFTQLPPAIANLAQLKWLQLRGHKLSALPPEIGNLSELRYLGLERNELTALPLEITKLTKLERLNIAHNKFSVFPLEITALSNLKRLNFETPWSLRLKTLPPEIGRLVNLEWLDLQNHAFTKLPAEIGNLKKLKVLELQFNDLVVLPPEIGQLTELRGLYLYANDLSALPLEFVNLKNLTHLSLSNNSTFHSFPKEITKLPNLLWLDFVGNIYVAELPTEIGQLTQLKKLAIQRNALVQIPPEIGDLTALRELNLSENKLTALPLAIGNLVRLERLDLHGNQFSKEEQDKIKALLPRATISF